MKQIKLIFISLILWSVAPVLQSCDKNDDDNQQQSTTSNGNNQGNTKCPDSNHPHMIDLGLPSGTKWACCNLGATKPEEYGNHYAWGETQTKSEYNWSTYRWGSDYTLTKYNSKSGRGTVDGKTTLEASDDAATANWGAPWHMPTKTQIEELQDKTISTWTTENGVNGWKFTGSNGGSIFLPAAGYCWESGLDDAGANGYYWSSTLYESAPVHAYGLYFDSEENAYWGSSDRARGHSVRPVR